MIDPKPAEAAGAPSRDSLRLGTEPPSQSVEKGTASPVQPKDPAGVPNPVVSGLGAPVAGPDAWFGESFMAGALYALAGLAAALGIAGGLYRLWVAAEGEVHLADWLAFAEWTVGGLAAGGILAAVAVMLPLSRLQRRQVRLLGEQLAGLSDRLAQLGLALPNPKTLERMEDRLDRLDEALAEVARNSLLDEAQRAEKRRELALRQRGELIEQIRRDLANGQWDRATGVLDRFRASFPSDSQQVAQLAAELKQRREEAETKDIAAAAKQCEELLSVSAWDRAVAVAADLVRKLPGSPAAQALAARVQREHRIAQEQQRQGLYGQIQRHTSRREWKEAVHAAERLLSQFPESIEAEAVKAQMETLAANAEIQHRQGVEQAIKDLVKRQRFDEAVHLAEQLIQAYPNSPQAAVLREQIGRLKERAEESARQVRKRRVRWP